MISRPLIAFCCLSVASYAHADDWPQFRGPDRSNVSKEKGLLQTWPKGGPPLAWTFKDAGLGFGTMSIAKGVVYTLGTDMKFTDEYVIALGEKDGKEIWRLKIAPLYTYKGNAYGDGPRSTPTIDGNLLFALSGLGDLVCIDLANRKELWRKSLPTDLGGVIMDKYGWSESPLVDGQNVICTPGGPKGTLAALDKTNGKVVWRSKELTDAAPFSSIIPAEIHGVRQYIQTSYHDAAGDIHGAVSGFDAKSGNLIWTKPIFTAQNDGIGSSPVVSGNQVYVTAGFGGGCHLFEIGAKWDVVDKFTKKATKKVKNAHGGVLRIGNYVYGHTERATWMCQDLKKGDLAWAENGTMKAQSGSLTAADGKLYLYSDEGDVGLVDADPMAFKLAGAFTIPIKSTIPETRVTSRSVKIWSHPVIANGHLYLRDHEYIFAFKITK